MRMTSEQFADATERAWAAVRAFMESDAAVWWLVVIPVLGSVLWRWLTKTF